MKETYETPTLTNYSADTGATPRFACTAGGVAVLNVAVVGFAVAIGGVYWVAAGVNAGVGANFLAAVLVETVVV